MNDDELPEIHDDEPPEITEQRQRVKKAARRLSIGVAAWIGSIGIIVVAKASSQLSTSFFGGAWLVLFGAWFILAFLMIRAKKEEAKLKAMVKRRGPQDAGIQRDTRRNLDPVIRQDDLSPQDDLAGAEVNE